MPVSVFLMLRWGLGKRGLRLLLACMGGGRGRGAGCFRGTELVFTCTFVLVGITETAEPFNAEPENKINSTVKNFHEMLNQVYYYCLFF